ncbi:MAG: LemA family protein [Candidatus Diapherotrites archaeon]|nr:LemA family protein [Candidatus Diapherotrites archaeon]MDZ4256532.1 LemA family protein [archaeon]
MAEKGLPNWVAPVGIAVVLVLFLGLWVMGIYNGATQRDLAVDGEWANVQADYQRRVDLIPNLVNTVKGVAGFEQETLTEITQLRTQWQQGGTVDSQVQTANQLESTLSKIILTFENYPELTATQAFRDLMAQLEGTENRISVSRKRYNDAVREYNTYIRLIPNSFFVGDREAKPFFESVAGAENAPIVPTDFT